MRRINDPQGVLDFQGPRLAITKNFYKRYAAIGELLDSTPRILQLLHADLCEALDSLERERQRECPISSDNVLRTLLVQRIEGLSLRETVVRIDDSDFLRRFVRVYDGGMMGYSTLCRLKNQIQPATWKKINAALAKQAVEEGLITGADLRIDTTAYETNTHYPTDSSLLFDVYKTVARLIGRARELDSSIATDRRLQVRVAKKHYTKIARKAGNITKVKTLKPAYKRLIRLVKDILEIATESVNTLSEKIQDHSYTDNVADYAEYLIDEMEHYCELAARVIDQTQRRVMQGEKVPNEEKLFSIHEPHTELLIRGKAGKPVEFGHMVLLQQTREKFISDFDVFEKKPIEHQLVDSVLASHKMLFGEFPSTFTADKGFYENMERIKELEEKIELVAIGKKGSRTIDETAREHSFAFRLAQAFRAGIEGSIAFLKCKLRMHRCFNKGWDHYVSTVGVTVFAHNLLVLVRDQL